MGLFKLNREPYYANDAVAEEAAQEKWGKAALVGSVATKEIVVQDMDPENPYHVDLDKRVNQVAEEYNQERTDGTLEDIAVADFIDSSNAH